MAQVETSGSGLPLRRITLYRSGVGAFERRGLIDGDANVQLRFDTKQINDILKSMIVLDLSRGNGRVEGVSYGSKEPLSKRLSSFAVDISDSPSTQTLLGRLRGAEVSLKLEEGRELIGTVLGVETRQEPAGAEAVVGVAYVNVLAGEGVVSVRLPQVVSFDLRDAALKSELDKALRALAEYRADRTKAVDIRLAGQGSREIVVGYVQEAPVWKTSYRLILPDAKKDATAGVTLQGWAIVENTTDEDWNQVRLALVSGRPVSFTMDLYEPLYVKRPDVPVPTEPGVMPRAYEGGQADLEELLKKEFRPRSQPGQKHIAASMMQALSAPMQSAGGDPADPKHMEGCAAFSFEEIAAGAARSRASGREVGEVFQYELEGPVTVERQRSAMLPILSAGIEGRRVSIYNPADGSTHPMRGVEIVNTSELQLIPGPICVIDAGAYAGDAQVGHVPAGDRRLLAYAVDLEVDVTTKKDETSQTKLIKVIKGSLEIKEVVRSTTSYEFMNKDRTRERTLIVEHPRVSGWTLIEPAKPAEHTAQTYRFELKAEPGKPAPLAIVQESEKWTRYRVGLFPLESIVEYSKSGVVSPAVVNAFRDIAARQAKIDECDRLMKLLASERGRIGEDQARVRANMNTIDRNSELYRRYLTNFTEQEARLGAIQSEFEAAQHRRAEAQDGLDAFIADLTVE